MIMQCSVCDFEVGIGIAKAQQARRIFGAADLNRRGRGFVQSSVDDYLFHFSVAGLHTLHQQMLSGTASIGRFGKSVLVLKLRITVSPSAGHV